MARNIYESLEIHFLTINKIIQAVQAKYRFKHFKNAGHRQKRLRKTGKAIPDYAQDYTVITSSTLFQKL